MVVLAVVVSVAVALLVFGLRRVVKIGFLLAEVLLFLWRWVLSV